jgi:3-dehydroquinate synthase
MTAEQFLELMQRDKKVIDGRLRLILLDSIGSARVVDDVASETLAALLSSVS